MMTLPLGMIAGAHSSLSGLRSGARLMFHLWLPGTTAEKAKAADSAQMLCAKGKDAGAGAPLVGPTSSVKSLSAQIVEISTSTFDPKS